MQMLFFLMQCNFFHKDGVGLTNDGKCCNRNHNSVMISIAAFPIIFSLV
jgi:hypothetical protein